MSRDSSHIFFFVDWEAIKQTKYDFAAAILEWCISCLYCIYFFTLLGELKRTTIYHPRLLFKVEPPRSHKHKPKAVHKDETHALPKHETEEEASRAIS